jgi:hypothetical protein
VAPRPWDRARADHPAVSHEPGRRLNQGTR